MAFLTSRPDFSITMPDLSLSGVALLQSITANRIWKDSTLQYGFGTGQVLQLDTEFAREFHAMFGNAKPDAQFAFATQAKQAYAMIDAVSGLDFEQTLNVNKVDLVLTSTNDKPRSTLEGFNEFPGTSFRGNSNDSWSIGAFNSGMKGMTAKPETGGGQYSNWTILHEIGHSLGLKHTHKEVSGQPPLDTVGQYMDNERYSVMSYKAASEGTAYGHAVSMMALDVAALQALYGVSTYAEGGSTYTLMNAKGGALSLKEGDVQIGRAYYCIWDSGGNDTINYKGSGHAVMINLNDATLDTSGVSDELQQLFAEIKATNFYDYMSNSLRSDIFDEWHHAGGFFSQVLDVKNNHFKGTDGGFSIAHGAEIENAVGSSVADLLIGNEQSNRLSGLNGADTLLGSAGGDVLSGGKGNDWLDGGSGRDVLVGGAGKDIFVFSTGGGQDRINDFSAADDVIDLRRLAGVGGFDDLVANHMENSGDDVVITVGADVLVIKGHHIADLSDADFAF